MTRAPKPLGDAALDDVAAAGRDVPYSNFNFKVAMASGEAAFDGRLLTAGDLTAEQAPDASGFSDVGGLGFEVQYTD